MFDHELLAAIMQFLKSSTGKDMLGKLLQVAGNFIKKIPTRSEESNSPNFESTKNPSYTSTPVTGLGIKTASLNSIWLGLLIGLTFALVWNRL